MVIKLIIIKMENKNKIVQFFSSILFIYIYNMENIKPYLGKIEDTACFLNNGKFGWYLNYGGKLYSVPKPFQSAKLDIKTAIKIIYWKEAHPTPSQIPNIAELDAFEKAKKQKKKSKNLNLILILNRTLIKKYVKFQNCRKKESFK